MRSMRLPVPTLLRRFLADRRGNVAIALGLGMPAIGICVAGAMDINSWYAARQRLQVSADGAALAAAKELQLASATADSVSRIAEGYVRATLADNSLVPSTVTATSSALTRTVQVDVAAEVSPIFSRFLYDGLRTVSTRAVARLSATAPICLIGLDPSQPGTLNFQKKAQLTANRCAVYSNSKSPAGLQGADRAMLKAALFCSAGGFGGQKANFDPSPVTDCPAVKDPLADRTGPPVGPCTATKLVIDEKSATRTLTPGTYCGGLTITKKARVTLLSGVYVIKDGPLVVNDKAGIMGQDVALYFSGDAASLLFDKDSTISLSAPKSGPMAGLLMSEERQVVAPEPPPAPLVDLVTGLLPAPPPPLPAGAPKMRSYRIISDDARMLLGTIYLPSGRLMIDASKPVADRSAYTVIVARRLDLFEGPNLILNSDYAASDVPVPTGVGPVPGSVALTR